MPAAGAGFILAPEQWHSQGAVGAAAPPLAENPELHCILLLHNFTVQICQMHLNKG